MQLSTTHLLESIKKTSPAFLMVLFLTLQAQATDWRQFRGNAQDGNSDELLESWPGQGPQIIWKVPLTGGFSSFSIQDGKAYTLVKRTIAGESKEVCIALDAATGKELWASPVDNANYDSGGDAGTSTNSGGDGPRTTPTIDGSSLLVTTSHLKLYSLASTSGRTNWMIDLETQYGANNISWQNAASPLVEGDAIFLNVSSSTNSLVALNKLDGSLLWKAHKEKMTHATPVPATIQGVRQIIYFNQSGLMAVSPSTGKQLWKYAFSYSTSSGASPVVCEDMVYCSAAYSRGAAVIKISKVNETFQVKELWKKSNALMNHWSTPIAHHGYLYGLYGDGKYGSAPLKCVEMATGLERWSVGGFGMGGIIQVSGKLLVLSDFGDVVMVNATPEAYQELGRWRAVTGKCWNAPALSNGRLYVRSTKEGVCAQFAFPPPCRMQLVLPEKTSLGRWRIGAMTADGSSFDASRLGKIDVLTTSLIGLGAIQWEKADVTLSLTNGVIYLEENFIQSADQRFYLLRETP